MVSSVPRGGDCAEGVVYERAFDWETAGDTRITIGRNIGDPGRIQH